MHLVFSGYSRTLYFKTCLDSIKDQITDQDVSLVLDGPCTDIGVQQNINLFINTFKHRYPNIEKRIHTSPVKIWHDANIINAFNVGFETSDSDYMIFIEDDMKFHPMFIQQMNFLWKFVKERDDIATFSCFSHTPIYWQDEKIIKYKNHLVAQHHQCATGISRRFYNNVLRFLMVEYLIHITIKYNAYDLAQYIKEYLENKYQIYTGQPGSWDLYYASIANKLGYYRVSTSSNYLCHIGEYGINTNSSNYISNRWGELCERPIFKNNQLIEQFIFEKNYEGFIRSLYDFQGKNWEDDLNKALNLDSVIRY